MDDKSLINSEEVTNVRNIAISRRGGVRTRGGRLPPVNLRQITQMTGNKKVMVPNVPQRRKNIKKEIESLPVPLIKTENRDSSQNSKGRGRGRNQKVFLQTEGSFLAEGPAAKLKKDPVRGENYARSSYSRKNMNNASEAKVDSEVIKELLESYNANQVYENDDCEIIAPYRLPLLKEKIPSIKSEVSEDEIKKEIKEEFVVDAENGTKIEIKTEVEDDFKIAKDEANCKEQSPLKIKNTAQDFQYVKDGGELILLQFPQLTITADEETTEKSSKNKQSEKENEQKMSSVFVDNLQEGFIGKLKFMKSGKIKIVIGSTEFELTEGSPLESYLEVASLQVHEDEADLALLGKIRKKMIVCPMISTFIPKDVETDLSEQ